MRIAGRIYILGLICLAGLFSIPELISYHGLPIPSFYSEWIALILGIGVMIVLLVSHGIIIPKIVYWMIAFAIYISVSAIWNDAPYAEPAIIGALYVVWAAVLMIVGRILLIDLYIEEIIFILSIAILMSAFLNAIIGIIQVYNIPFEFPSLVSRILPGTRINAYGNIAQNNHYADYLTLGLVSLWYLVENKAIGNRFGSIVSAIIIFSLVLSGAKSEVLYIAFLIILYATYNRKMFAYPIFFCVSYAITSLLVSHFDHTLTATAVTRFVDMSESSGIHVRYYLWTQAWLEFTHHPILGVGFGNYIKHFYDTAWLLKSFDVVGYDKNAHNVILMILAETGIIGFILFCGAVWSWIKEFRFHWYVISLLGILGIHSMVEYPLWYANFLGITAILIGVSLNGKTNNDENDSHRGNCQ